MKRNGINEGFGSSTDNVGKETEYLRKECIRLGSHESIEVCCEMLDIYSNFILNVVKIHHSEMPKSELERDGKMILQMMLTKTLYLKQMLNGVKFRTDQGVLLNNIIDPVVISAHVRTIYEMSALFNYLFVNENSKNDKEIKYKLWVLSSLNYRQRFNNAITSEENRKKFESEGKRAQEIKDEIICSKFYNTLGNEDKKRIDSLIKKKDFLYVFRDNKVHILNWRALISHIGVKMELMEHLYSFYSFYSHPSNVAVIQFADMFNNPELGYKSMSKMSVGTAFNFISIFIADFIKFYPSILNTFNNINLRDQIIIDFFNKIARGNEFSINKSYLALE